MPWTSIPARGARGRPATSTALAPLLALLLMLGPTLLRAEEPAPAPAPAAAPAAEPLARWYEGLREGKKVGWAKVVWTASTWEGQPSVHDHTELRQRTARDMAGHEDVFDTQTTIDLERHEDGRLWWQRIEVVEAGRKTTVELRWTGSGYEHVTTVEAQTQRVVVPLDAPVHADAEALVSARAKAGTLQPGQRLTLRSLDVDGRRVHLSPVEVAAVEAVELEEGPVPATRIHVLHPETKSEERLWIDAEGAFVKSTGDHGYVQVRASAARAQRLPARPPSFGITVPARPPLARIMSAGRLWVEVDIGADAERKLPDFPASPWGKVAAPVPLPGGGARFAAELTAYEAPAVSEPRVALPIVATGFERELEATALMPCGHVNLKAAVAEAADGATDARTLAHRLARWVHDELEKQSTDVAQASALQILEERKGDCSEHALLFVALCRTAGIPARLCSGYVNIGPMWGAHAWAEIWLGRWCGADPTTGEIGTGARYLFFGYQDTPDSYPGVVSARVQGRIQIRTLAVAEGGVRYDLDEATPSLEGGEGAGRWWVHPSTGVEARGLPEGWTLSARNPALVQVRGPGIRRCQVFVQADQGATLQMLSGERTTFGDHPALTFDVGAGSGQRAWFLHSRRRLIRVTLDAEDESVAATLATVLAPTFADVVTDPRLPPRPPRVDDVVGRWLLDREATQRRLEGALVAGLEEQARSRLGAQLERVLASMSATLSVEPAGAFTFELALRPPESGLSGRSSAPIKGRVEVDAAGLRLDGEDGTRQRVRLEGGRLVLESPSRTLVLSLAPGGR